MNREAIEKTIKSIEEAPPEYFGMEEYFINENELEEFENGYRACGTPACIAGHAIVANGYTEYNPNGLMFITGADLLAMDIMDIPTVDAEELFHPNAQSNHLTAKVAVTVLRNYLETGQVNWRKALEVHNG